MTELRKQANRMMFNQAEDEFIDGEDTIGLGTIGAAGSGRLRAVAAQQRQKLSAKAQKVRLRGGTWSRVEAPGSGPLLLNAAAPAPVLPCPHPAPSPVPACQPPRRPPLPAPQFALKNYGSSGATSGLSSSLAFTPIQGIELANPNQAAQDDRMRGGTESYFSEYSGFRSSKSTAPK